MTFSGIAVQCLPLVVVVTLIGIGWIFLRMRAQRFANYNIRQEMVSTIDYLTAPSRTTLDQIYSTKAIWEAAALATFNKNAMRVFYRAYDAITAMEEAREEVLLLTTKFIASTTPEQYALWDKIRDACDNLVDAKKQMAYRGEDALNELDVANQDPAFRKRFKKAWTRAKRR